MSVIKYKAYIWSHFAFSDKVKGIQSAHCVAELCRNKSETTAQWMDVDKTLIFLDGGNSRGLKEKEELINRCLKFSSLPSASFYEDEDTLGKILTSVGTILPDNIFTNQNIAFIKKKDLLIYSTMAGILKQDCGVFAPQDVIFEFIDMVANSRLI
jgi:hypothetical protein